MLAPYLIGAGDGTRTHDILLGKQTLYRLSYTRVRPYYTRRSQTISSPLKPFSRANASKLSKM